jgi:hypothetical protein
VVPPHMVVRFIPQGSSQQAVRNRQVVHVPLPPQQGTCGCGTETHTEAAARSSQSAGRLQPTGPPLPTRHLLEQNTRQQHERKRAPLTVSQQAQQQRNNLSSTTAHGSPRLSSAGA